MTLEELKKLIAEDEGETVEVKETTGQRVDACETLCAFLNKDGGTVVFGVTKKGKLTGQLVSDKTKRELFEVFAKFAFRTLKSKWDGSAGRRIASSSTTAMSAEIYSS